MDVFEYIEQHPELAAKERERIDAVLFGRELTMTAVKGEMLIAYFRGRMDMKA